MPWCDMVSTCRLCRQVDICVLKDKNSPSCLPLQARRWPREGRRLHCPGRDCKAAVSQPVTPPTSVGCDSFMKPDCSLSPVWLP